MNHKNKSLFIGNFLQKQRGSLGISQKIVTWLYEENGIKIPFASEYDNRFYRFIDIVKTILFLRPKHIIVDTYSGNAFIITIITFLTSFITNSKVNCVLHGGRLYEFYQKYPYFVKFILQHCTCYTPSLFLLEMFRNENFNITYLPNPVKLENFKYVRKEVKPFSMLWVRAFDPIYNPEIPIKVLASLKKKYPDITLTMIGPDRGLLNKCKTLAQELEVSQNVSFIGSVPNKKLYLFYQTHSIYLNTTSYESFGVAAIEAASCGIPIISNKVGEIPYLWEDGKNILMVNNNCINSYIKCATSLFEEKSFANSLSTEARKKAITFDWEFIKPKWLNMLNNE